MKKLVLLLACLSILGCAPDTHSAKSIKVYKVHNTEDDDLLFLYVMMLQDNQYQYVSSSKPIQDISKSTWTLTNSSPVPSANRNVTVEEEVEMEAEIAEEVDISEGDSEVSSGNSSTESTETSSSESSGDSSGGDSGGGSGGGE